MGIMWGERVEGRYKPSLIYRLFKPKDITGSEINGLGETEKRCPTPICHWFGIIKVPFNRVWWQLITWTMLKVSKELNASMAIYREYADKPYESLADEHVDQMSDLSSCQKC